MDALNSRHPDDQTLNNYGLGKLDDELASMVNGHLEGCDDCRQRVAGLTSDSFLGRLREIHKPPSKSNPSGSSDPSTLGSSQNKAPSRTPSDDTLPPGLRDLSDYELIRELGRGGMGVVYLAHNLMMGRDEVLKIMGRHISDRPAVLERFQREIKAVAKLRHPNIVTAYSAFRIDGGIIFSMEYVEGLDLAKLVKAKGPLAVAHAAYFAYQAALGLQHAHEKGLIHRDIKPHNLMLAAEGRSRVVKVLDFGLAKASREEKMDAGLTAIGQALGTPDYIAPEQIMNAPDVDIRADVYSLGGTLFYLLTGRPPFQANSLYDMYQAHISREVDPLNLIRPEVPAELAALVSKMMAKEPGRRFKTPGEVAEALAPFFRKDGFVPKTLGPEWSQAAPSPASRPGRAPVPSPDQPLPSDANPILRSNEAVTQPLRDRNTSDGAVVPPSDESSRLPSDRVAGGSPPRNRRMIAAASASVLAVLGGILIILQWNRDTRSLAVMTTGDQAKAPVVAVPDAANPEGVIREVGAPEDDAPAAIAGRLGSTDPVLTANLVADSRRAPVSPPAYFDLSKYEIFDAGTMWRDKFEKEGFGRWYTEGDHLIMKFGAWDSDNCPRATVMFGDPKWTDYDFRFRVKQAKLGPDGFASFIMVFRSRARQSQYEFMASSGKRWPQTLTAFDLQHQGGEKLGEGDAIGFTKNNIMLEEWYTVRAEVREDHIKCFLSNGAEEVLLFDVKDARHPSGRVGLKTHWGIHHFKDIKVTSPDGRVLWEGLPRIPPLVVPELIAAETTDGTKQEDSARQKEVRMASSALPEVAKNGSPAAGSIITNSIGMKLAPIPAGEFMMGSPDSDLYSEAQEKPAHRMRVARPFQLGIHEVTQGQYRAVTGESPSRSKGDDLPVELVSWKDAIEFCNVLSEKEGLKPYYRLETRIQTDGDGYRLPTEAEWEYACRAGSTTRYSFGDRTQALDEFAWYATNSGKTTHPVGQKHPNGFGLFDMHGNVAELCWDAFLPDGDSQPKSQQSLDPLLTSKRVYRGGHHWAEPRECRSACRRAVSTDDRDPYGSKWGFRVARGAPSVLAAEPSPTLADRAGGSATGANILPNDVELIKNGGCEDAPADGSFLHWEIAKGAWSQGSKDFQPIEGNAYFYPGNVPEAELRQDVDVSRFAETIDGARQVFKLTAQVITWDQPNPDTSRVVVEFLDQEKKGLGKAIDSGPIASTRQWKPVELSELAPRSARWARVRLISLRNAGGANDASFDAIRLTAVPAQPAADANAATRSDGAEGQVSGGKSPGMPVVTPVTPPDLSPKGRLKSLGLTQSGAFYVVALETAVGDKYKELRPAVAQLQRAFEKLAMHSEIEANLAGDEEHRAGLKSQIDDLSALLRTIPGGKNSSSADAARSASVTAIREGLQQNLDLSAQESEAKRQRQGALGTREALSDDYRKTWERFEKASGEFLKLALQTKNEYDSLKNNPEFKEAVKAMQQSNKAAIVTLGPSRDFQKAVASINDARRLYSIEATVPKPRAKRPKS